MKCSEISKETDIVFFFPVSAEQKWESNEAGSMEWREQETKSKVSSSPERVQCEEKFMALVTYMLVEGFSIFLFHFELKYLSLQIKAEVISESLRARCFLPQQNCKTIVSLRITSLCFTFVSITALHS